MTATVTATEWGVSYSQTSGPDYHVTTLRVHRSVDLPNEWGGRGVIVRHWADGFTFQSTEAAHAFTIAVGLTKPFEPGAVHVDPADWDGGRGVAAIEWRLRDAAARRRREVERLRWAGTTVDLDRHDELVATP